MGMIKRVVTGSRILFLLFWFMGGIMLLFILFPLWKMCSSQSITSIKTVGSMPDVQAAIFLSIESAVISALVAAVLGIPLAYILARHRFPGRSIIEAIIDLPLAIPHTVVGIALLFVFGRTGLIGKIAGRFGISFWGTSLGIVIGMLFVSMPYMVNSARESFERVDIRIEKAARTLGASPAHVFWKISMPLAVRGILSGIVLTYARSIAEFGAVIVLAYYPETAPVKIYELFLSGGLDQSTAAAVLLFIVTLSTFILFRYLAHGRTTDKGGR